MEENELSEIAQRREEARNNMEATLRTKWEESDLHVSQIAKRTGIGWKRLWNFLDQHGPMTNFTDKELVAIHTALS